MKLIDKYTLERVHVAGIIQEECRQGRRKVDEWDNQEKG